MSIEKSEVTNSYKNIYLEQLPFVMLKNEITQLLASLELENNLNENAIVNNKLNTTGILNSIVNEIGSEKEENAKEVIHALKNIFRTNNDHQIIHRVPSEDFYSIKKHYKIL